MGAAWHDEIRRDGLGISRHSREFSPSRADGDPHAGYTFARRKYGAVKSAKANTHPTVKPLELLL
jgi:hypothetical protein